MSDINIFQTKPLIYKKYTQSVTHYVICTLLLPLGPTSTNNKIIDPNQNINLSDVY